MSNDKPPPAPHPSGEPVQHQPPVAQAPPAGPPGPVSIDSWAGQIKVEWDPGAPLTPLGQAAFFIEFLKVAGLFEALVADCPLARTSPNAPTNRDVVGTIVLSVLAGHKRYAHVTTLRADGVLPELLGIDRILSEDAVRRALAAVDEAQGTAWLQRHLDHCTAPLLGEGWILDADTTIKPLYGRQEGALLGYNPKKPGRPSHAYHSFILANLRLVLDVAVMPGNEHTANHAAPGLWALLERIGKDRWPRMLRADKGFCSDALMARCEAEGLPYLLRLRLTKNVKRAIERMADRGDWSDAGQGWQGIDTTLKLTGWTRARRIVLLRRRIAGGKPTRSDADAAQLRLSFAAVEAAGETWEHAALVTTLCEPILGLGQLYRDRADCENAFDELKNQWGWGGFTTHDLARCRHAARLVALVYDWWNLFTRLAEPDKHLEAITSRPLLLTAIAERIRHARQTTLRIASSHGDGAWAAGALARVAGFLRGLVEAAEQLTPLQRWYRILSHALRVFLGGRELRPPTRLSVG
jgi:Transposase DDE domain group 1